jgi:hypothetical protein
LAPPTIVIGRQGQYTLSDTDLELIRRHRRDSTQLGFAVQLSYARLPGRVLPGPMQPWRRRDHAARADTAA